MKPQTRTPSGSTGRLVVVATPIGNLQDLSPRAAEVLRSAHLVLCEDTRHSRPLLDRVGFVGETRSCHAHNERERSDEVCRLLQEGHRIALVSDAGAPAVSDPGGRIVQDVIAAGFVVEVVPGPSAVIAALMGAGLDAARFAFLGFLPRKGKERETWVRGAAQPDTAVVLFEAANRVEDTLSDLHQWLGPRRVVVARELSKLHETFHRGLLGGALAPPFVALGEAVIVVEAGAALAARPTLSEAELSTLSPKARARHLAERDGISVKDAYARALLARDAVEVAGGGALADAEQKLEGVRETLLAAVTPNLDAVAVAPALHAVEVALRELRRLVPAKHVIR